MRPTGIVLLGDYSLPKILQPLVSEVAPCCWLIDVQSGPFDSLWRSTSPENDSHLERKFLSIAVCENTSASCWRPFTLPRLAEHVILDEWTQFYAFRCAEDDVSRRAEWVMHHLGRLSSGFFDQLSNYADLFLIYVDGWWELYTPHHDWRHKFQLAFPESRERSWRKAGEPPEWK